MRVVDTESFTPETELESYLKWVINEVPIRPWWMPEGEVYFMDHVSGIVVHRHGQFQTQLFIAEPNAKSPPHTHPNVDSFEVGLYGMNLNHTGNDIPASITMAGVAIYVDHEDVHGGCAGEKGGAFLSVQQWLNDVPPTCVANDWKGEPMGPIHAEQIQ